MLSLFSSAFWVVVMILATLTSVAILMITIASWRQLRAIDWQLVDWNDPDLGRTLSKGDRRSMLGRAGWAPPVSQTVAGIMWERTGSLVTTMLVVSIILVVGLGVMDWVMALVRSVLH